MRERKRKIDNMENERKRKIDDMENERAEER